MSVIGWISLFDLVSYLICLQACSTVCQLHLFHVVEGMGVAIWKWCYINHEQVVDGYKTEALVIFSNRSKVAANVVEPHPEKSCRTDHCGDQDYADDSVHVLAD
jgi:hypothetical protein